MRIHEFAKRHSLSSKDLVEYLSKSGFPVAGHMSVLSDEALNLLERKFVADVGNKSAGDSGSNEKLAKVRAVSESVKHASKSASRSDHSSQQSQQRLGRRFGWKTVVSYASSVSEVVIPGDMPLYEVAKLLGKDLGEVVLMLLQRNLSFTRNQLVPKDVVATLAQQLGIRVVVGGQKSGGEESIAVRRSEDNLQARWPIVVIMGHVDHGKTTLLDFIRKSSVAARERGGITQHVGAYEVETAHGKIIFLDTPGHEAFTSLRGRGASVTDIVVLVVAADDGVKPQTVEAIEQAKKSGAPIIVVFNKIDKPGADKNLDGIKRQLAQHDVLVEDWGGQTVCVPLSAKTGHGVESLLEMIVLQAEMMELRADPNAPARAYILESKVERGYGPVSTVIPLEGTLKKGDFFVAGDVAGKVRLLIDSEGDRVSDVGPSVPVMVVGFDSVSTPGSVLEVVSSEEHSKVRSSKAATSSRMKRFVPSAEEAVDSMLVFMIKADTHGSIDALHHALSVLSKKNKHVGARIKIISSAVGDITEGDVLSAADVGGSIIGLGVKADRNAVLAAKQYGVEVFSDPIIYRLVEAIEKHAVATIQRVKEFKQVGKAEVRKVFDMKGRVIAGCYVIDGVVGRGNFVVCMRNGEKAGEGKINSLQRNRNVVKDVAAGYECGFVAEGFSEWQVGDIAICFVQQEVGSPDGSETNQKKGSGRR